jgi:hypothetical protein
LNALNGKTTRIFGFTLEGTPVFLVTFQGPHSIWGKRKAMETQLELKKELQRNAVLSGAMMVSVLLYAVVVEIIKVQWQSTGQLQPQPAAPMKEVFYGAALFFLFVIRLARKAILKKTRGDNFRTLLHKLKLSNLVTFLLCEVPAVVGLVLFLRDGLYKEFYILATCSLLVMFIYFPRYRHWEAWLGKASSFY